MAQRETQAIPAAAHCVPTGLTVNERHHVVAVDSRRLLIETLREDMALTGTKPACLSGHCGACTVHLDGEAVYSCQILTVECQGRSVTTIEGIAKDDELSPVQRAFIDCDAFQCGFCTPGQIMSLEALLARNTNPDDAEIERALVGNLCRCGAYQHIRKAARQAVENIRTDSGDPLGR